MKNERQSCAYWKDKRVSIYNGLINGTVKRAFKRNGIKLWIETDPCVCCGHKDTMKIPIHGVFEVISESKVKPPEGILKITNLEDIMNDEQSFEYYSYECYFCYHEIEITIENLFRRTVRCQNCDELFHINIESYPDNDVEDIGWEIKKEDILL